MKRSCVTPAILSLTAKPAQSMTGSGLTLPSIGIAQSKHSIRIRLTRIGLYSPTSLLGAWLPASLILAATGFGFGFDEKKPAPAAALESIKPSSIGEKPSWVRGWSAVRVEIPDQAKLMDAHVTFKTPAERLVRLARGITSNEGVSIDTIQWSNEPLEAQVIARKESEVAKFDVEAALVSSSDTLKPKSSQIEFESKFIELSDADARALRIPSPAPNTVRVDLGTLAPESANVLYEGAAEKLFDGVAFTAPVSTMSAPRVTTRSRQRAVIEIIRELRYASEYKPNPDTTGPSGSHRSLRSAISA
ncbi:MAG: hypothetical protein JWL59_5038 [Chthoniobacteraceae bacterium]|nr:hypothetical protein [Chthoniobacteraceae bacterium]